MNAVVLDDRLLIHELLVGMKAGRVALHTTTYWYYRACRAAVAGAGGHLSGPFAELTRDRQELAILTLLTLREDIGLPDPRQTVPVMAAIARRHPQLNLLSLEAAAAGKCLNAAIWLSAESARGVLPAVLDAESIRWRRVDVVS